MRAEFPKQKISRKEKYHDDNRWCKDNIEYFIEAALDIHMNRRETMNQLLSAYDGELNEDHYKHVLNPYNVKGDERLKKFPTRLRNYNILKTPIDTALGEKAEEADTVQCIAINEYTDALEIKAQNDELDKLLQQMAINHLNKMGLNTGIEEQQIPDLKGYVEMKHLTLKEKRAVVGGERLEYLKSDKRTKNIHQKLFADWLKINHCFTYKDVRNNDVIYRKVDPRNLYVIYNPDSPFIEDGYAALYIDRILINEAVDKYRSELEELTTPEFDPIEYLEGYVKGIENKFTTFLTSAKLDNVRSDNRFTSNFLDDNFIDEYHVVWVSFRMVKIVRYQSLLTGQIESKEVDEEYELMPELGDIDYTTEWIDEIWEGTKLGNLYLRMRPILVQRNEINNTSKTKLPYNGLVKLTNNGNIYSWLSQGMPYQIIVNILYYQMEKLINKNRDKLVVLPKSLMPNKPGWNEDVFMYYGESTGYLFVDDSKSNAAAALNAIKVIDASLSQYIMQMRELIQQVTYDYYNQIGFSPQRLSDVKTSAGKATTEAAIVRSFITSKELFREFDEFIESEYQGLLDYSKVAWINGKKGVYTGSDGQVIMMNIDGIEHMESEYAIFAKDNAKEATKLKLMRDFAFSFAQNDRDPSVIAEVVDTDNFSKIKDYLKKAEENKKNYEMALAEKQNEGAKYAADKTQENIMMQIEANKYAVDRTAQSRENAALINANARIAQASTQDEDPVNDYIDEAILMLQKQKIDLERDKHNDIMNDRREQRRSDEKIAKENKN